MFIVYTSDNDSGWNDPSVKIITIHLSGPTPCTYMYMVPLYTIRWTSQWLDDGAYCILYTGYILRKRSSQREKVWNVWSWNISNTQPIPPTFLTSRKMCKFPACVFTQVKFRNIKYMWGGMWSIFWKQCRIWNDKFYFIIFFEKLYSFHMHASKNRESRHL